MQEENPNWILFFILHYEMNILIVCDKFKSSLSAKDLSEAIDKSLSVKLPNAKIIKRPFADGGDGTLDIFKSTFSTKEIWEDSLDPFGRKIQANYLIHGDSAIFELAAASGIALLHPSELNPMLASTFGTGQLLSNALKNGFTNMVLCLGGSCSNDTGIGIASALGFKFLDKYSNEIQPVGANLQNIDRIVVPPSSDLPKLDILCDVSNPLYGLHGAAYVFAKQKGASEAQIIQLDKGLHHFSKIIEKQLDIDISNVEGGGAAGGIAAGLYGMLGATLHNGFDYLSKMAGLEKEIRKADLIITGEGKLDLQSLDGKLTGKVGTLAKNYNKRLIAIVGSNELPPEVFKSHAFFYEVLSVSRLAKNIDDAMQSASRYVERLVAELSI